MRKRPIRKRRRQEAQAADESVIEETGTASGSTGSSAQVAAPAPAQTMVVSQAAAQQASTTIEGAELEGEDELGTVGAAHSIEQAAADTAATLTEISQQQEVTLVDLSGQSAELNQQTLNAIAEAAADHWRATGLSAAQQNALANASYVIADLEGPTSRDGARLDHHPGYRCRRAGLVR